MSASLDDVISTLNNTNQNLGRLIQAIQNLRGGVIFAGQVAVTTLSVTSPTTQTGAAYSVGANDSLIIANNSGGTLTLTLPAAASFPGRILGVKTTQNQTVVSASSNVVPLVGGAAGTAILAATSGKWAKLVSDGTNWIIMAGN